MPLLQKDAGEYRFLLEDGKEIGPFRNIGEAMEYKRRFKLHTEGYEPAEEI